MACTGASLPLFLYFLPIILVLLSSDETLVSVNWVRYFGLSHPLEKLVDCFKVGYDCMYPS